MPAENSRWLTWLAGVPILLLGVVLLLAWGLRAQYETRLRRQIWPDRPPQISVISNAPDGPARTVLFLGDTRMAQWGLPSLAHWRVVNAGTSGLTTGQIRQCAPALLDQFHPDAVVLQAGINDFKYLALRPSLTARVVSLSWSNLVAIIDDGARHHCQIILLATWPTRPPNPEHPAENAAVPDAIARLNRQLQTLDTPEKGVRVVDLFKEAGLKPNAGCYEDALHLTPAAYERLTPLLEKELNSG